MAKRLLLNVLLSVLGDYIEGLSEDNLKLGVWSGEISLNNLQLNRTILQRLNLPVVIAHGSVKSLHVVIPWATLESNPLKIRIDGVSLQIGPLDLSLLNAEDLTVRALAVKQFKLQEIDKVFERVAEAREAAGKDGQSSSYWQRLTAKIVDNIEITLTNLHVRYEDSMTIPGRCFSFGITLDTFSLTTRNKDWKECFVARDKKTNQSINKLAIIKNFGVYWNSRSPEFGSLRFHDWEAAMLNEVYTEKLGVDLATFIAGNQISSIEYILEPTNDLVVKVIHFENAPEEIPGLDIVVEITHLRLTMDKLQFLQLSETAQLLNTLDRQQQLLSNRPKFRPNKDPRSWWFYAVKLVRKNEELFSGRIENMMFCMRARKRYIYLHRRRKEAGINLQSAEEGLNSVYQTSLYLEHEELVHLESILPLFTLAVFRRLAASEEEKAFKVESTVHSPSSGGAAQNKSSSWWGWLSAESEDEKKSSTGEDDVDLDYLRKEIEEQPHAVERSKEAIVARLKLSSSASIHLNCNKIPVVDSTMHMSFMGETTIESMSAYFAVEDFIVIDKFTLSPVIENIVSIKSGLVRDESVPFFSALYEFKNERKSFLKISALPLQLVLNELCLQQLLSFFNTSQQARSTILKSHFDPRKYHIESFNLCEDETVIHHEDRKIDLATILSTSNHGIEIVFEAETPKIIIPENSVDKSFGFGLFDAGNLKVCGYVSFEGMVWDISLGAVNAGMPLTSDDMYSFGTQSLYLIRPFDVHIKVQTINKLSADMSIDVQVQPEIRGELDASKLARLLTIIRVFIKAFTVKPKALNLAESSIYESVDQNDNSLSLLTQEECLVHWINVRIEIPVVSLNLFYSPSESYYLMLSITELNTEVVLRYLDMQVFCRYSSLFIEDSIRSEVQKTLLRNKREDETAQFIYKSMSHQKSPLYKSHAQDVIVNFKKVIVNADVVTLLHLQPFVSVLLGRTLDASPSIEVQPQVLKVDSNSPKGIRICLNFESLSLSLFRLVSGETSELESTYLVSCDSLYAEISLQELMKATVSIRNGQVFDIRNTSRDNIFRTIFCPLILSENGLPLLPELQKEEYTPRIASKSHDDQMIMVNYEQEKHGVALIAVSIHDVISFISLDVLLDLIEICVSNALAIFEVIVGPNESAVMERVVPENDDELTKYHLGTINVIADVFNFLGVLLDDPSSPTSRAIVSITEQVQVHYHRDITARVGSIKRDLIESVHVSVKSMQGSMLINVSNWLPIQVIEPLGLEFHLGRRIERDVLVSTSLSLDIDNINARLSFHDIVLVHSIVSQRALTLRIKTHGKKGLRRRVKNVVVSPSKQDVSVSKIEHVTTYSVSFNVGQVRIVLVNDFNRKNLPVFQIFSDSTIINVDGVSQHLEGIGKMMIGIDFYNPKLCCWEPFLESWKPQLKIVSNTGGIVLTVNSVQRLQFNVTGIMLQRLLQTYSVALHSQESDLRELRTGMHDLLIKNSLGVEIDIHESNSSKLLFKLSSGEVRPFESNEVTKIKGNSIVTRNSQILLKDTTINVYFTGKLGVERMPVCHLPLNTNRPQIHVLQSAQNQREVVTVEPIIEEVFENERFDPLRKRWVEPFVLGDFAIFSDADGDKKLKSDIILPTDWEWQGDWHVDVRGDGSNVLDGEGFAYNTIFQSFTSSNVRGRRERQKFDCVRRRRWIRIRQPVSAPLDDPYRPLIMFWDMSSLENGSRIGVIRSHFQISNNMPFPILVSLSNNAWTSENEFGPIEEGESFCVPLLYAYASSIKFRPASLPCTWSTSIGCSLQAQDVYSTIEVICEGADFKPVCMRVISTQVDKTLTISCVPYIILTNRLPCTFNYKVYSGYESVEEGSLRPGISVKLVHHDLSCTPKLSLQMGSFGWSKYKTISVSERKSFLDFYLENSRSPGLILTMLSRESKSQSIEVDIYSRGALIDSTGLRIDVLSRSKSSAQICRNTFAEIRSDDTLDKTDAMFQQIDSTVLKDVSLLGHFVSFSSCVPGKRVYYDDVMVWKYFPPLIVDQLYLLLPNNSTGNASPDLSFTVEEEVIVVIFVDKDKSCSLLRKWLRENGYVQVFGQCIAYDPETEEDIFYELFGRVCSAGDFVQISVVPDLDANSISLCVLSKHSPLRREIEVSEEFITIEANECWVHGGNGLTLFDFDDGRIAVGAKVSSKGPVIWSKDLDLSTAAKAVVTKMPFEIHSSYVNDKRGCYLLAYKIARLPGSFHRTELVTVMSRYCIVNYSDEPLDICQGDNFSHPATIKPYDTRGWHLRDERIGTKIRFRFQSTGWSLGFVDINDIGTSVFLLPPAVMRTTAGPVNHSVKTKSILHVEVKIAEEHENCMINVTIWKATSRLDSIYSIRNESDRAVCVRQSTNFSDSNGTLNIVVPPKSWVPFGWADQAIGSQVLVTVGKVFLKSLPTATFDFLKVDRKLRLPFSGFDEPEEVEDEFGSVTVKTPTSLGYKEVIISIEAAETGRVLMIIPYKNAEDYEDRPQRISNNTFTLNFELKAIGISLVLDQPVRREFLCVHAEEINTSLTLVGRSTSLDLSIENIQVDSFSETAMYPVLLFGGAKFEKASLDTEDSPCVLKFSILSEIPEGSSTVIYKYVALRVLPLRVEVDSATLQLLHVDFIRDLNITSQDEVVALTVPDQYMQAFNMKLMSTFFRRQIVDIYGAKTAAHASKLYIEELVIHPLKLLFTFTQVPFPRKTDSDENVAYALFNILTTLAGVDEMELKFNSFIVSGSMESFTTFKTRVIAKLMQDFQSQIGQVAGSLSVFGSPIGLVRNIGEGLQDFFYEPILGAMDSPGNMIIGIGKGTSSLVQGVLSGALNSTTAFAETAGTGLAFLSGDADFIRKRAQQRQRVHSQRSGIFEGLVSGTDNFLQGVSSGVSGLFKKPIEEAQQDGLVGFFRGVGLGVLGVAVKPVLGVTDGISTMAIGISKEVGNRKTCKRIRTARTFERSSTDSSDMILVPLDMDAIKAQDFVLERARSNEFEDSFVAFLSLTQEECIVLSEVYVYWKRSRGLWGRTWSDISHIMFMGEAVGIMLYGRGGVGESVAIECANRKRSERLYSLLAANSFRMGNPSNVIPADLAFRMNDVMSTNASTEASIKLQLRAAAFAGELNGHRFGRFNGETLDMEQHEEPIIFSRARNLLSTVSVSEPESLDRAVWSLVCDWDYNHGGLQSSRCSAILIINDSFSSVTLNRIDLGYGKNYVILGSSSGYHEASKTILPKDGFVIVFVWAHRPSPIEVGHLNIEISTSAFTALIGSRPRESSCVSKTGFTTGFLEKTVSEWWSKFVVVINAY